MVQKYAPENISDFEMDAQYGGEEEKKKEVGEEEEWDDLAEDIGLSEDF